MAESPLLKATVRVAHAEVRGLMPLPEGYIALPHGPIPTTLFAEALGHMALGHPNEMCVEIVWDNARYAISVPKQEGTPISVHYDRSPDAVLTLHSHPDMDAFFSSTDDQDEQGLGLFGVVGIHGLASGPIRSIIRYRVGVYGHFAPVAPESIFGRWPWPTGLS